jgi:hypothetical protein
MMGNIGRSMMYGIAGGMTTRLVRRSARKAMHTDRGLPRIPREARRRSGFGTMLLWAAGTGAVLAIADVLREQQSDSTRREY